MTSGHNVRSVLISLAVWVELHGIVGVVRLRLQLTPDPPFFSLCTLTFLGQPKVDVACVPLSQKGLDIMDLPLISNFVQSAVDAAMAEYVAPKSLTLDLKGMLMGDDFKKDTQARGLLMASSLAEPLLYNSDILQVRIRRAYDFKEGDAGQFRGYQPFFVLLLMVGSRPRTVQERLRGSLCYCWLGEIRKARLVDQNHNRGDATVLG